MVKFLNLDDFQTGVEKTIIWRKKEHAMKSMTIGDFMNSVKAAREAAEKAKSEKDNFDFSSVFGILIDNIRKAFPTLTDEDVAEMRMEHAEAIFNFVRDTGEKEVSDAIKQEGLAGN